MYCTSRTHGQQSSVILQHHYLATSFELRKLAGASVHVFVIQMGFYAIDSKTLLHG